MPGLPSPPELPLGILAVEVDAQVGDSSRREGLGDDDAQRDRAERGEPRVGGVGLARTRSRCGNGGSV